MNSTISDILSISTIWYLVFKMNPYDKRIHIFASCLSVYYLFRATYIPVKI